MGLGPLGGDFLDGLYLFMQTKCSMGEKFMFEGLEIMVDGHEIMVDGHEIMFEGMYSMPFEHVYYL